MLLFICNLFVIAIVLYIITPVSVAETIAPIIPNFPYCPKNMYISLPDANPAPIMKRDDTKREVLNMAKDERNAYTIQNDASLGEVKIADEVVAIIAALAATEVDGVASMAGNITNEVIGKLGIKNLSKGVKVDVLEGVVTVSLALNLKYDYSIMEVTKKVQEKVKNAVENMTGLEVADVNIKVAGVEMEKQN